MVKVLNTVKTVIRFRDTPSSVFSTNSDERVIPVIYDYF